MKNRLQKDEQPEGSNHSQMKINLREIFEKLLRTGKNVMEKEVLLILSDIAKSEAVWLFTKSDSNNKIVHPLSEKHKSLYDGVESLIFTILDNHIPEKKISYALLRPTHTIRDITFCHTFSFRLKQKACTFYIESASDFEKSTIDNIECILLYYSTLKESVEPDLVTITESSARQNLKSKSVPIENIELLSQLVEDIQDWIIETDTKGIITFSNQRSKDFIDYEKAEIIGTPITQYIREDQRTEVLELIMNRFKSGLEMEFETIIFSSRLGEDVYVDASITPFYHSDGTIKGLRGVHRNITERIKREELFNHYRLLADYSNINIFFFNQESGKIIEVNEAATGTYGYTKDEFLKMHVVDLRADEYADNINQQYDEAKANCIIFRTYHKRRDKTVFPVEVSSQPTQYMGKRIIISLVREITDTVNFENQLKKINRSLYLISECNQILIRAESEETLYKNIMERFSGFSGYKLGWIAIVDSRSILKPEAKFGIDRESLFIDSFDLNNKESDYCMAVRSVKSRNISVEKDLRSSEIQCGLRHAIIKQGFVTAISLPIMNEEFIYGSLTLYSENYDQFDEDEIKLLSELTDNIGYGITSIRKRDELRIIENNARKSETLLRKVLDNLPVGVIYTDKEGNFIYENPEAIKIWGEKKLVNSRDYNFYRGKSILTGKNIDPDDWAINRALKEKTAFMDELLEIYTFDGKTKYIQNSAVPFFNSAKEIMGGIILIRDITSGRVMEKALKYSEMEYKSLIEGIADIVLKLDKNLDIVYCNNTFESAFGYQQSEIINRNFLDFVCPNFQTHVKLNIDEIIDGKTLPPFEIELTSKTSQSLPFELSIGKLRDSANNLFGFHCVARDINERKRLENQLLQSQKMEAIGRLAGGIAHDFNNILTIIFGYSDFLMMKAENYPEMRSDLQQIFTAGKRASALTQQLLAFSRREIIELKSLNLNEVILELKKMLNRLIGEDIKISFDLDPNLKRIKADIGQVDQIIMNLVVNSRDAMPDGGSITIETANFKGEDFSSLVKTSPDADNYIRLSISDTGTGIKAEHINNVFDPFFTTKSKGKGTGLGLSVVYGIVKQYGGEILIESEYGKGTSFRIFIPSYEKSYEVIVDEPEKIDTHGKGETILLVEDDEEISNLVTEALKLNNYSVLNAPTLQKALEVYGRENDNIDLVFSDVVLPDGNGVDLIQMLKAIKPDLKILLASGYADEKSKWSIIQEKKYNFISKPFDIKSMFTKLRHVFDHKE